LLLINPLHIGYCCVVEVVGALLSVMLIWVVTALLVYLAVQRVINQDYEIDAPLMIIMAGLSVAFNIASVQFHCLAELGSTVNHLIRSD